MACFHAQESRTGNCEHIREWQAPQGRQRGHYNSRQPGVGHHGGHHGGGNLGQGHHPQGMYGSGRLGQSNGVGMHGRDGQDVCYDGDCSSSSSSTSSSDDSLLLRREPYRLAGQGPIRRGPAGGRLAGRGGIARRATTGRSRGVWEINTNHDPHDVSDVQGTSVSVGEGQSLGGMGGRMRRRLDDRTSGRVGNRTGGMVEGIVGGRRGGNESHVSRENQGGHGQKEE